MRRTAKAQITCIELLLSGIPCEPRYGSLEMLKKSHQHIVHGFERCNGPARITKQPPTRKAKTSLEQS